MFTLSLAVGLYYFITNVMKRYLKKKKKAGATVTCFRCHVSLLLKPHG